MATAKKSTRKFKIKYVFPDHFNPTYATGALGGPAPNGDIVINFFVDRMPLPNEQVVVIEDSGRLGEILENDPRDLTTMMVRVITGGVMLNLTSARSLHEWLGRQIQSVESSIPEDGKIDDPTRDN